MSCRAGANRTHRRGFRALVRRIGPAGRKELENEVLYDSVRTYASAVSDLRAAAAQLNDMTADPARQLSALDKQTIEQITKELGGAFERYEKAEREFLKRWAGER